MLLKSFTSTHKTKICIGKFVVDRDAKFSHSRCPLLYDNFVG